MSELDFYTNMAALMKAVVVPGIPLDDALWDTETIALYLKRNKAVVRERITPMPGFPKAIRIPTTQGRAQPLYKASEVIEWALSHRDKH